VPKFLLTGVLAVGFFMVLLISVVLWFGSVIYVTTFKGASISVTGGFCYHSASTNTSVTLTCRTLAKVPVVSCVVNGRKTRQTVQLRPIETYVAF
jgi:hypothetical protein